MGNVMSPKLSANFSPRDHRVTRDDLRARIAAYSIDPLQDILAVFLQCQPDALNIHQWACEHPDRWANAVSVFAKLSGYIEHLAIDVVHRLDPTQLSDAELLQQLVEMRARLGHTPILELAPPTPESVPNRDIHSDAEPVVVKRKKKGK